MRRQPPTQPQDDEKTVMVGRRDGRGASQDTRPPDAGDDGKTMYVSGMNDLPADEDKTMFVAPTELKDENAARIRSSPSPRLSWPARDQHTFGAPPPVKPEDAETHPVSQPHLKGSPMDDDRTRLFNPATLNQSAAPAQSQAGAPAPSAQGGPADDPVVGWLVVVDGPGKGRSIEIGIGANALGRDPTQKLRVDFGDQHISREKHAVLV